MAPNLCPWREACIALDAENTIQQISAERRPGEFEIWLSKQHIFVQAAFDTLRGSIWGAIDGVLVDFVVEHVLCAKGIKLDQVKLARLGAFGSLLESTATATRLRHVRNFAVLDGVRSGVSCVMKKFNHNDAHTSLAAAFGSGVVLSLVNGIKVPGAVAVGIVLACVASWEQTTIMLPMPPKAKDTLHNQETNFNTGFFTSNALAPLNDRKYCFCYCGKELKGGRRR